VPRSGTNQLHGGVFETHRNTATSANDYFIKQSELQSGAPNQPPKLIRNNFGAFLGGPIKKDRLFFFVNYEGHRQREAQSVVRIVPSAALQDGVVQYACADPSQCPGGQAGPTAMHTVPAGNLTVSGPDQGNGPAGNRHQHQCNGAVFRHLRSSGNDNSVGDGLNFVGFRFKGPVSINTNWYIARADTSHQQRQSHVVLARFLRNDNQADVPYLPNTAPERTLVDYSKGYAVGYTAVLRQNLVNNFRYGYTRQSFGQIGNQTEDYLQIRTLNDFSTPNNSSLVYQNDSVFQVPVHNFVDDVSWVKGRHTLQFGVNVSLLRNPQANNINSFSQASDNASWFDTAALAATGAPAHFDPGCSKTALPLTGSCFNPDPTSSSFNPNEPHYPLVDPNSGNNYDDPLSALVGMVPQVSAQYNYTKSGAVLPDGALVKRRFAADTWEWYGQDTWKIKPNLTLTLGLRYSLFSPPWETEGLQVTPTTSLSDYFNQRGAGALAGTPASAACCLSFVPGGPANHAPGFYN
jgi:hypothetical protein